MTDSSPTSASKPAIACLILAILALGISLNLHRIKPIAFPRLDSAISAKRIQIASLDKYTPAYVNEMRDNLPPLETYWDEIRLKDWLLRNSQWRPSELPSIVSSSVIRRRFQISFADVDFRRFPELISLLSNMVNLSSAEVGNFVMKSSDPERRKFDIFQFIISFPTSKS